MDVVVRVDAENEFHLDIEDFLNGVCSLCSELVSVPLAKAMHLTCIISSPQT